MEDWNDLRYLLAIERHGTLAGAARALKVDQSTVGRRLAVLAKTLGVKLLDRTPDGLVLTPAGERARAAAQSAQDAMLALEREIQGGDARAEGLVRVTAPDVLGTHFLAARLPEFRARHPGITLDLVLEQRALNLARREADVALRMVRPTQDELVARKVARVAFALYATEAYLARARRTGAEGLAGHDLLVYDPWLEQPALRERMAPLVRAARVVFRSNSLLALAALAATGAGLTALPCYVAAAFPALRRVPSPEEIPAGTVWLVAHEDLAGAARVRAVMSFLREVFERDAAVLEGE